MFFDYLQVKLPLRECNASALSAAIAGSTRSNVTLLVPGCRLEWFFGQRACALLAAVGGLQMSGDSLARHMLQSMREALVGDFARGVSAHIGKNEWICSCDGAYDDGHSARFEGGQGATKNKFCRENSFALLSLPDIRKTWPQYCPAWNDNDFAPQRSEVPPLEGYHLLQGGLHKPKLDANAANYFFGPQRRAPGVRAYIFTTQHSPGLNKPVGFLKSHGMPATLAYNDLIREHARKANASILDAFAVTKGARSIDGQHYYHDTNVVLAQLLLNLVYRLHIDAGGALLP